MERREGQGKEEKGSFFLSILYLISKEGKKKAAFAFLAKHSERRFQGWEGKGVFPFSTRALQEGRRKAQKGTKGERRGEEGVIPIETR